MHRQTDRNKLITITLSYRRALIMKVIEHSTSRFLTGGMLLFTEKYISVGIFYRNDQTLETNIFFISEFFCEFISGM